MLSLTKKIFALLSDAERVRFRSIFALVLIASFLEVIGISSIMPFIAILADPTLIERSSVLASLMAVLHADSLNTFVMLLGVGSLLLLVLSNAALALSNWRLMQFTYGLGHTISSRLLTRYLRHSYEYFLSRSTSDAKKNVLDEAVQIVNAATVPFMQGLAKVPVVVLIVILVLVADPLLAPVVIAVLGGAYVVVYQSLRKWLARIGNDRVAANQQRFRIAHESLDALVDIKLLAKERRYQRLYDDASSRFANAQALSMTLAITPRYALEAIAFGGILVIALYLLATRGSLGGALPLITLYALAGYRLMPALQTIFAGFTKARFAEPALDLLHNEIVGSPAPEAAPDEHGAERMPVTRAIQFANVDFVFQGRPRYGVRAVSLEIPARGVIGIAGATGSGKTTIANLLLGLLPPTSGDIRIDGVRLDQSNVRRWQRNIGYVSQQIYIADSTIRENIALGEASSEIDEEKVVQAARAANLHEFIVDELPHRYDTVVGERGTRLSGGQRQRLAIARALYRNPDVLVFDEATSALDSATEDAVMEAINALSGDKTIVVIAHRLNTLRQAQTIYLMDKGAIIDHGSLDELAARGALHGTETAGLGEYARTLAGSR